MPQNNPDFPKATDSELAILNCLWDENQATVRQVHEKLQDQKPVVYTSVLKILQIMHEKGLVGRNESERSHVYFPLVERRMIEQQVIDEVVEKVFQGSMLSLVLRIFEVMPPSAEEVGKIKAALDKVGK